MTEEQAQKDVRQVENLRRQNAAWRIGSAIAIIAILGIGLGDIVSMGQSLMTVSFLAVGVRNTDNNFIIIPARPRQYSDSIDSRGFLLCIRDIIRHRRSYPSITGRASATSLSKSNPFSFQ